MSKSVLFTQLHIMFQGGFVGQDCELYGILSDTADHDPSLTSTSSDNAWVLLNNVYPLDNNSKQISFFL